MNTHRLADLVIPGPEDVRRAWPVFGSLLLMAGLHAARRRSSDADDLRWGAYEKERTLSGQWWRVVTYAYLYRDGRALASDAATIALCSAALTRRQGGSVAFATFRLGLFVGLLAQVFRTPGGTPVTSVSGPAYSMLGALLANAAHGGLDWSLERARDRLAAGALLSTVLVAAARVVSAPPDVRRARLLSALAGAVATNLAAAVALAERKRAAR